MIKLSICIATYNRGSYIGDTLRAVVPQLTEATELLIVDGASPDNTGEVVRAYALRHSQLRYFCERENSGVDRDYDKAVTYARGEYCWLMTDDDLLLPGAVDRVLSELRGDVDLLVVNAEVRNVDMRRALSDSMIKQGVHGDYSSADWPRLLAEAGPALSFIGATVVRRAVWLARDRASYFGSLFVHVGVIFQAPMQGCARVISTPLIAIRYGNAMWTARGFEVWMFKWPQLIWSFSGFPDEARLRVVGKTPWRRWRPLLKQRGNGAYGVAEYRQFIAPRAHGLSKVVAWAIARMPGKLANSMSALYCALSGKNIELYDMARSAHATWLSRWLGRDLT